MQSKTADADKSTARNDAPDHDSGRDIELIDEQTVRRLEDEPEPDEPGCRFAAVARSLESTSVPQTSFSLPCTRVAYVDESGQYGIERQFFGHRPDWSEIPRTVVVTDTESVREIPSRHTARYESILAIYQRVLAED
ncbi:hypothetical protein Htur_5105 (plasmid) [Haloterrigena turkmenica DSM 5511]|uniref:Uncharacterized protein n=1 Tax=Haloterrigena turkmenica (strain ATCC 51198 / DSM 5511 / JCM 9101 / NCIMB 13204 / VKM B-1734 / 4k) TaxID=543526 RepID=D2S3P5_HALTV|nr:hypothetical protein [Haloterrigena turkmenica]ADB63992.1 hypothetical protein Htur_5105 [Haloterrigena turkmenica DSM 5511]